MGGGQCMLVRRNMSNETGVCVCGGGGGGGVRDTDRQRYKSGWEELQKSGVGIETMSLLMRIPQDLHRKDNIVKMGRGVMREE